MLAHPATRLLLAPVLLAQAMAVRRRALRLPEPEGAREGCSGQGPELRLLIAGDSSAAGVGVPHQDAALAGRLVAELARDYTVRWQLHATTGHTTQHTLARLRALPEQRFDIAVTALGVNDVTRQLPARRWAARQAELADLMRERFGVRAHWRSGLPPMDLFPLLPRPLCDVLGAQARAYDMALAASSRVPLYHLPFDPLRLQAAMMAEDGFHPGAPVYAEWARELAVQIRAVMG
jgi:lysophospholipase L1-like esterase